MHPTRISSLALSAALLALGCWTEGVSAPAAGANKTAVAAHMKTAYTQEMRKRLEELELKYTELKNRVAETEGRAKHDLERKIDAGKLARDAACRKLDALKDSGSDGWQKAKEGFETALAELNSKLD